MSMASSSSSTPASTSQLWKYHVFLSFRGEDTRKTFVDHLYTALIQKGIYTYKDDETLDRGESIAPSLMKAIEESQIAMIVFSKNYADSSWCLDELEYIMKCKDTRGQVVMPIFYDVDPSEVRYQKHKYGEAFSKHELRHNKKVESWRKALENAANISGWEPANVANGHESKFIKEIVETISHRLHPITSSVDEMLVGVETRMHDLISKLEIGFGGKKMVGIWGVGGGGKTTLASSIYDEVSSKFDGCCFIKNIREESSKKNGVEKLQEELLCDVLQQKEVTVRRVEEGRRLIKDRLHQRKVLIVLDDVDNLEHLEELAGSHDWFGEGSRVIITTRDKHVLTGHKVDVIHNITLLNNDEAMQLFCKQAPRGYIQIEDYKELSKDVVSYAGGLPLAIRVLGRFLCDKELNEWRSALARLKEIPEADILEKLKISFDGLKPVERELFLDIACFFRGHRKDEDVMMTLDACGFHPVIGIKILVQKALITVSEYGNFNMHDLVQEMALYIVRGEHPKNPEKHSRLWQTKDVMNSISVMDATTNLDKIEVITFLIISSNQAQHVLRVAANMKKLRWINLNGGGIEDELVETTVPLIPEFFSPRELCVLTLNLCKAKQLWEGHKYLPNLRMIKLQNLINLMKTPDFDGLPNLERFMVYDCRLLEEIHPSIGRLEKLLSVEIQYCDNLKMVPPINRSKILETLVLSRRMKLSYNLSKIQQNVERFVPHNMNHIGGLLRKLDLDYCNLEDGDIKYDSVWELPNLQKLKLAGNRFVRLDFSLMRLPRLQYLNIKHCIHLVELVELPISIAVVIADGCTSLESFGDISNCKRLWKVSLLGVNKPGPLGGDILLVHMLQGIAKDYFISIELSHIEIWKGFVPWLDRVERFTMCLPDDWYNDYCGILMFVECNDLYLGFDIIIKQGVEEDFQHPKGSCEIHETRYDHTYVGYVSFNSLRHTGCLNSTYNVLSFSSKNMYNWSDGGKHRIGVVPVRKDDSTQTTKVAVDSSDFWDEEVEYFKTFTIQRDSNSSVKIVWTPVLFEERRALLHQWARSLPR